MKKGSNVLNEITQTMKAENLMFSLICSPQILRCEYKQD